MTDYDCDYDCDKKIRYNAPPLVNLIKNQKLKNAQNVIRQSMESKRISLQLHMFINSAHTKPN